MNTCKFKTYISNKIQLFFPSFSCTAILSKITWVERSERKSLLTRTFNSMTKKYWTRCKNNFLNSLKFFNYLFFTIVDLVEMELRIYHRIKRSVLISKISFTHATTLLAMRFPWFFGNISYVRFKLNFIQHL